MVTQKDMLEINSKISITIPNSDDPFGTFILFL